MIAGSESRANLQRLVVGRVLLGVDAIYRTGIYAGGVFGSMQGSGNDIGHSPPSLPELTAWLTEEHSRAAEVNFMHDISD